MTKVCVAVYPPHPPQKFLLEAKTLVEREKNSGWKPSNSCSSIVAYCAGQICLKIESSTHHTVKRLLYCGVVTIGDAFVWHLLELTN